MAMQVIGLMGGVGSGKSYVARYLQKKYGAELLLTDDIGHEVTAPGTSGYQRVVARFGEGVVCPDGRLDRQKLAAKIFADSEALADMNHIVHPAVKAYIQAYIQEHADRPGIILLESAILLETGCDVYCDRIWYVRVSQETRIQRLMKTRGYTAEKAKAIMDTQGDEGELVARADLVIPNNGDKAQLEAFLDALICQE